ncbi:tetratricopeptide repeat protein [Litchfieldia alkalitelluris]|uniref:tetratricopeptide repeat protein n=1 Tax=Litchfieldia alkalitelluris TaxID=304268 RepID=UPI00099765A7|nr:hypothetical protein [Litchfieldia alkalitelluris]
MSKEEILIEKKYYTRYLTKESNIEPITVLGELYFAEHQNEFCDLSYIRFAQGELYFQHKDYETAIFKWENIENELSFWAKKNMADAYVELDLLPNAEELYLSISAENQVLATEVALKLFSLYWTQGKVDSAKDLIKEIVSLNPDYKGVTDLARSFFEEQKNWEHAIELAVNEAIRTEELCWFDTILSYIKKGITAEIVPSYFTDYLLKLHQLDLNRFEDHLHEKWNSYKDGQYCLNWIEEVESLLNSLELDKFHPWKKVTNMYQEIYLDLTAGTFLLHDIEDLLSGVLVNWFHLSNPTKKTFPAAAIVAWSEIRPSFFSTEVIEHAKVSYHATNVSSESLTFVTELYHSIQRWADKQSLTIDLRFRHLANNILDLTTKNLMVVGTSERGKISIRDYILGEQVLEGPSSCMMSFGYGDKEELVEISMKEKREVANLPKYHFLSREHQEKNDHALLNIKLPVKSLKEHHLTLLDAPCNCDEFLSYVNYVDKLLFVLNIHSPFTDKEKDLLLKIKKKSPELPVVFILTEIEEGYSEQEIQRVLKVTKAKINSYDPSASIIAFKSSDTSMFNDLVNLGIVYNDLLRVRSEKIIKSTKDTLKAMVKTRHQLEKYLNENISFNKEMTSKLNGAIHQLQDVEKEKIQKITANYGEIKTKIAEEIKSNLPLQLKKVSELVNEESDLKELHSNLNKEMNKKIEKFLRSIIEPLFLVSIQEWITEANDHFNESRLNLEDLCESLNRLYGEEKIKLNCDFKVLDDWKRDADRLSNRIQIGEVDIFLRFSPSQLLFKSAGKLLGAIPQKTVLLNKYKQFIENKSYDDVIAKVTTQFLSQFEFFEKAIERDITMFFKEPLQTLKAIVEETIIETDEKRELLHLMNSNPEVFRDALALFEVRIRQYELMTGRREIELLES